MWSRLFAESCPVAGQPAFHKCRRAEGTRTQHGHSASNDNSYEIVEFDARPDTTYDIRIQRASGTDDTYYGIAWTVFSTLILDPDVPPIFEPAARRRRR